MDEAKVNLKNEIRACRRLRAAKKKNWTRVDKMATVAALVPDQH